MIDDIRQKAIAVSAVRLTCARCTTDHDAELDSLLDILFAPYLHLCELTLILLQAASLRSPVVRHGGGCCAYRIDVGRHVGKEKSLVA